MAGEILRKKICLLGDPAVGKSSLIKCFVHDIFDDKYLKTIGAKVTKKNIEFKESDTSLSLMIWDIMGQLTISHLQEDYYKGASGALMVCDVTRAETVMNLHMWCKIFTKNVGKVPIVFIANKYDLRKDSIDAALDREIVKKALEYKTLCLYTSAKTGQNVERAFMELGRRMVARE